MSPAISHLMIGAAGVPLGDPHEDIGEHVQSLNYACNGVNTGCGAAHNDSVNDWISWGGMSGQSDGGQFNRWVTHYNSGTAWTSGGIAIASGHNNNSDPLGARDVGFYYSTDTTNGTDGNWNVITPTGMYVAQCKKHSSASNYTGNRTSTIDSNHVRLSANTITEGYDHWQGRNNAYIYNRGNNNNGVTDCGNIFDVITWEPIANVKGIRTDVRSKWDNGHYSNEKPHVAEIHHFKAPVDGINEKPNEQMEDDPNCTCYVDPKNYSGGAPNLPDSSGEGYNFNTGSGGSSGTWTYNSGNGGHMTSSGATLRNGSNVNRRSKNAFSYGGWFKLENNGGGLIWYGNTSSRQHCFIRNNIGPGNGFNIGADIEGGDYWDAPHVEDVRIDHYVSNYGHSVGTTWHFFCVRQHGSGLIETSMDGKPFELQKHTRNGNMNSISAPFGIGCDPYNDNSSSHAYGPFWFYTGIVPLWRVKQEWNRLKTRFNR